MDILDIGFTEEILLAALIYAFSKHKIIFVNDCFWYGHICKNGVKRPKSNCSYLHNKIAANQERDVRIVDTLPDNGWKILVAWECQLKDLDKVIERLRCFLSSESPKRNGMRPMPPAADLKEKRIPRKLLDQPKCHETPATCTQHITELLPIGMESTSSAAKG